MLCCRAFFLLFPLPRRPGTQAARNAIDQTVPSFPLAQAKIQTSESK